MPRLTQVCTSMIWLLLASLPADSAQVRLRGQVVDAQTGSTLPARVYIRSEDGSWFFVKSESSRGSAIEYRKQRQNDPLSVEMHTSISAHPFSADLPPGRYTITALHGKEYFPKILDLKLGSEPVKVKLQLRRWIDMAERGWYSGETHVHRSLEELPTLMLAEDLNVTFPLSYWVGKASMPPISAPRSLQRRLDPRPLPIDKTHVIYPMNTEYEITSVAGKRHTLGAFFVLGHQTVFREGVPPLGHVAGRARKEGALLELDKHNWPWSMAIVPIMDVDLFELTNNHVWRTQFAFRDFGEPAPEYMGIEQDEKGMTEWGWIDYGFQNYYALLNCGFRLRPTAGTASGVHPVPLGFGRVYVKLEGGFSYEDWFKGLDAGRSFVTTGPMLFAEVNGHDPGHAFGQSGTDPALYRIRGSVVSAHPTGRIEIVQAGQISHTLTPANKRTEKGAYESPIEVDLPIDHSTWIAIRSFENRPDQRIRFAHSAPFYVDVPGKPLRPQREQVEFLIRRVQGQIERSSAVLPKAAIEEYSQALRIYETILETTRDSVIE